MMAINKMRRLFKRATHHDTQEQKEEKMIHAPLPYKVCLDADPCPHYFESQQKAYQWLLEHGEGHVKKRTVIEFAFPLEQKIAHEAWVRVRDKGAFNSQIPEDPINSSMLTTR